MMRVSMKKHTLIFCFTLVNAIILSACSTNYLQEPPVLKQTASVRDNTRSFPLENPQFWQGNPETIWARLQQVPLTKLEGSTTFPDPIQIGWVKLAIISKRDSNDTSKLTHALAEWRTQYPQHPGNQLFTDNNTLINLTSSPAPRNIAVLVPLQGPFAALGNAVKNGFADAAAKAGDQQTIIYYDTNANPNMIALYEEAVSKGANMVIGPLTKNNVKQLTSRGRFTVPTLELNYTDNLSGLLPPNLYQFGLSPLDEAKQVADKASQAGYLHALIIAPQTEWGQNVAKTLIARWEADGGHIADQFYFPEKTDFSQNIALLLHINPKEDRDRARAHETKNALAQQRRQDFDVIFLLAPPASARQIVPLLRFYYVDKTPIYATSIVYSGTPQPDKDIDLNGVIFCDTPSALSVAIPGTTGEVNRLFAVGKDAYLISRDLARFSTLSNFPAYTSTGALTLTPQKQFYRRLAWAQFHDGHP